MPGIAREKAVSCRRNLLIMTLQGNIKDISNLY